MNKEVRNSPEYQSQDKETQKDQAQKIVIKEIHLNKYNMESTLSDKNKLNETNWAI